MDCRFAVLVLAFCFSAALAERGFLLTSSRSLNKNATNPLQLRMFGIQAPCTVTIRLLRDNNDTVLAEETVEVPPEGVGAFSANLALSVPHLEDVYNARLDISGYCNTEDGYTFNGTDQCYLRDKLSNVIFLQTDKPFYKPGQIVKVRAMLLDENLRPLQEHEKAEIWIEDPQGARMAQWRNVSLDTIKQFEMPLSEEPVLGNWKISCTVGDATEYKHIDVKEYVLPKFDVTIKPPSFVLADVDYIPIQICSRYTHGNDVEGELHLNVSLESYSWTTDKFPVVEYEGKIKGCLDYVINVSKIDTDSYYSYRRINCVAKVTELGTKISRDATKLIDRTLSPLKLTFKQDQRENFKPGLPYKGKVFVSLPDDTSAANELIEICASVSRKRTVFGWAANRKVRHCKNFTTDDEGVIDFTIPPQNTDAVSIALEAKSVRFANPVSRTAKRPTLHQPQASASLRPYFSPSGSFMQLQAQPGELPCDSLQNIELLFTAKDLGSYQFFYEVVSKNKVVNVDSVELTYTENDDVSNSYVDPKQLVDAVTTVLVPSGADAEENEREDCPSAKEARYVPPIGRAIIPINMTADLSGSFYLLVYYLRSNREVVADSHKFLVEKCFKNKVTMEFGDKQKQPGATTSVHVHAAPNSMCGVKAVDRSVLLQDDSGQLTREGIFRALEKFESGYHFGRNHCNEKVRQPGLMPRQAASSIIIDPPRPWSNSDYEDSITPFERSGFLVVSDLTLVTRPCSSGGYGNGNGYSSFESDSGGVRTGAVALASVSNRRPPPGRPYASKVPASETKSTVDIRSFFPEDWLFYLHSTDDEGEYIEKTKLPHTITEWVGSAVCLSKEVGLGLSPQTTIRGFQAFFVDVTLPYSVVRGEVMPLIVSIFNYLDEPLAVHVAIEMSPVFEIVNDGVTNDHCISGGDKVVVTARLRPTDVGPLNITVRAYSAESADVCGDQKVAKAVARDAIVKNVLVEPEGYPHHRVESILFSPDDSDSVYESIMTLALPEDVVDKSTRVLFSVTGDPMGPAIQNPDNLVRLPTGCGEQNMAKFFPNILVMEYLNATGKLTDSIKNKVLYNLNAGAQRQMKYRHPDGSFSAFGTSDKEGSIYLTAMCVRGFAAAAKYITIDKDYLDKSIEWLLHTQGEDGCFTEKGRTLDMGLKGNAVTAYVLSSILSAGYKNETQVAAAISCINSLKSSSIYVNALEMYTFALASSHLDGSIYDDGYQKRLERVYAHVNDSGGVVFFRNASASESMEVQTAAYVVLATLEAGGSKEKVLPIVRYLSMKRNSLGGFISTTDTIVGLSAISAYALVLGNTEVNIQMTISGPITKKVLIKDNNKLVVHQFRITSIPSQLIINATGSGNALIQVDYRYNTVSAPRKRAFTITADYACTGDCDRGDLTICVRYLPEAQVSSMCIVEAKMVSGMAADKESLNKLLSNKELNAKRHEVNNNNVVIYFDEFNNNNTCFTFEVERVFDVTDCKEAPVKVTDYYTKENSASTQYIVDGCTEKFSVED